MKRCPKCNCGAEFTNKLSYYASQAGGLTLGVGAGLVAGIFHRSSAGHVAHSVHKNITKDTYKEYECTNSRCGYKWHEQ